MASRSRRGSNSVDVVVVGGGVVGAASTRAVARSGASVTLVEQGRLTPAPGSSRGTARIIAPAAYPDASYLEMGLRALEEWRELERASGTPFLELDGALYAGSGVDGFAATFEDAGVEHEQLTALEVGKRFGITALDPEPIVFQPDAGVIRADVAREALLRGAAQAGAQLHEDERVGSIDPGDGEVTVHTTRRSLQCGSVIVAAGPWTNGLLTELGIELPVTVTSQSVAYFAAPTGQRPAVMEFDGDEPYALIDPKRGLKAALHRHGPETPADHWEILDTEALDRIRDWVRSRFPGIDDSPVHTEACLYTSTADERFIFDRQGPVIAVSACSGQGFQVAPVTGTSAAELALGGQRNA